MRSSTSTSEPSLLVRRVMADTFTASRRPRDGERLVVKLRGHGDEIVEDTANGILGHVAEQSLSARIP